MNLLFIGVALAAFFAVSHGQHVVFEEVGQIATSLSYLHVAVPLNISGISRLVEDYTKALAVDKLEGHFPFSISSHFYDGVFDQRFSERVITPALQDFSEVLKEMRVRATRFRDKLDSLTDLLPTVAPSSTDNYEAEHLRRKRFAPFMLPLLVKGVFGTIHGLYTRRKYGVLRKELNGVIRKQNRLITSNREQDEAIDMIQTQAAQVQAFMGNLTVFAPLRITAKLRNIEMVIDSELDKLWDAVQVAQQHRLSIRLMPASEINRLFQRIQSKAAASGSQLLLERPSDLYQIELSYCYDGEDVVLILHVPMAPQNTLLRLLKFLPFPFSLSPQHFLMPQPSKRLFALSSDEPRLSMELTEADLEGCHRVNNLFLCERQGTLRNRMDMTCLGALYSQKFRRATELCEMKALPISEQVLQLKDNIFLVYATQQFTAYITCRNQTSSEFHFQTGVNSITVSPGCKVKLQDHVLYADTALRDSNALIQFTFSTADTPFAADDFDNIDEALLELATDGDKDPTLDDLRQSRSLRKRYPRWYWIIVFMGIVGGGGLLLLVCGLCCGHRWLYARYTLKMLSDTVWPPQAPQALYGPIRGPPLGGRHVPSFARRAMEVAPRRETPPPAQREQRETRDAPSSRRARREQRRAERGAEADTEDNELDRRDPEAIELQERGVDTPPLEVHRLRPSHRAGASAYAVDFVRSASRRFRRQRGSQPDDLPAPFRRQRVPLW